MIPVYISFCVNCSSINSCAKLLVKVQHISTVFQQLLLLIGSNVDKEANIRRAHRHKAWFEYSRCKTIFKIMRVSQSSATTRPRFVQEPRRHADTTTRTTITPDFITKCKNSYMLPTFGLALAFMAASNTSGLLFR